MTSKNTSPATSPTARIAATYKARLKEQRALIGTSFPETLAVRLHRAISWLAASEQQHSNADMQFISLWIAFNASYGTDDEQAQTLSERQAFKIFIEKLVNHDQQKNIHHTLWEKFSGPVKALIKNQYVYAPFWQAQRANTAAAHDEINWQEQFEKSSVFAHNALSRQNIPNLLGVVLDRLYVLRNQLMHGGATYQSQVNRQQVQDGAHILGTLMPVFIEIMLNAPEEGWGEIAYPVVGV